MPAVNLDTSDATELTELLRFVHDWLAIDAARLGESLSTFVGGRAYDIVELRADLARFTFLLGGSDGEGVFAHEPE
ncbi:hypothetical protein ALI144C_52260 [Actinosynnema sp. ALI-1.44]|uniref:hypothetical protein n=1 Tax=Actinosynnema sp. ALI-1.44 TaxID=1933779 RepID=UPI00097C4AAA|nr:hypothetical protein [Actinosynnema sp. ALI-1.44]ONI71115.1 hypothetical protein ALI144C_52260 [Actinosynnema sp. ALI-1.44]